MNRYEYAIKRRPQCPTCGLIGHVYCTVDKNGKTVGMMGHLKYLGEYKRIEYGVIPEDEWNAGRRDFPILPR